MRQFDEDLEHDRTDALIQYVADRNGDVGAWASFFSVADESLKELAELEDIGELGGYGILFVRNPDWDHAKALGKKCGSATLSNAIPIYGVLNFFFDFDD
jgi:hypothetical protein